MSEALCLIDTDVLSYILKEREPYLQRSCEYLEQQTRLTISCLTYYECLRGHKAARATKQLRIFRKLLERTDVLYLEQEILDKAADMYGVLKPNGIFPGEIDLLIGATALFHDLSIVTNNVKHYKLIQRHFPLNIEDWTLTRS
ncbi:MAG: type II toxin-antitoxin system VapC family toxin [bacterium]|nr:type II toxin-antitoxin system VapC family toxin [bacterium]